MTNTLANIPLGYAYINFCLGGLSTETGWENLTYIFLCEEVFDLMGITAEPEETESIKEYKALLRWKALDHLHTELATAYDYSVLGSSDHRSQMFAQVGEKVRQAKQDAAQYIPEGQIELGRITFPDDPYGILGQIEHDE
jgi:hypothetical protein